MRHKALIFFVIALIVLSACTQAKIDNGIARDTIFSVELSRGGTYGVFLTHDESVVYCTGNEELGEKAKDLILEHEGEVIIHFKTRNAFENTEGELLGVNRCQSYYNGESGFVQVIITDIYGTGVRNGN